MSEPRTVLITGAAGFVARSVAPALRAAGWRVLGLDRIAPSGAAGDVFESIMICDVTDGDALERNLRDRKLDAIVHLAGLLPGRASRAELFAVNADATATLLQRVARPGTHVLLFSTGLVYGSQQQAPFREDMVCLPDDDYAQSKLVAEATATQWGAVWRSPVSVLRPSLLYGPGAPANMLLASLLEALRKGEPFAMTAGEQRRDFLHVDDAARAVLRLLELRAGGTWNVASGESILVRDAAMLAADIAGRRELLQLGALPYREHEVFDYRLDPSKLRTATGWQPRIDLARGLAGMWKAIA